MEREDGRSSERPAATDREICSAPPTQDVMPVPKSSSSPPQEAHSYTGGLVMDPSPLLQQLQLFQDQLRLFASPHTAAPGLQTPQQPTLAEQQAGTVKHRAPMKGPATSEVDDHSISMSADHAQPTAGQTAISSHEGFRQAMMERLRMDSQHLTHALSSMQGPLDPPSAHPTVSSPAQSCQYALSPPLSRPVHSTASPWTGSGGELSAHVEGCGGNSLRHVLGEAGADTSASAGSPASRALQSIRSMLSSMPEPLGVPDPASDMPAEGASSAHGAAESAAPRPASSSLETGSTDIALEETGLDAIVKVPQDSMAISREKDPHLSRRLSGVEREVVRILGPRYGSADVSPGTGSKDRDTAKRGSDDSHGRSTSARCGPLVITSLACIARVEGTADEKKHPTSGH